MSLQYLNTLEKAQQGSKRKNLHLVTAVDTEFVNQLLQGHLSRYPAAILHLVVVVPKPDKLTLRAKHAVSPIT